MGGIGGLEGRFLMLDAGYSIREGYCFFDVRQTKYHILNTTYHFDSVSLIYIILYLRVAVKENPVG